MIEHQKHILCKGEEARTALRILDQLPDSVSRTIFIIDKQNKLVGTLTDGDIRRGLLNGFEISQPVEFFMNVSFKFLHANCDNVQIINTYRKADINLVPVINEQFNVLQILDLRKTKTLLPLVALIMAGGRGERLRPFTDTIPKPMLKIGGKPLLEHNIDRLVAYGISEIYISVKYLKEQIIDFFGDGSSKGIQIQYLEESEPLGTLGALSLIDTITREDLLVMNSDLLTNIDFEDFYNFYKKNNATMALASIPYNVDVPYAVLQTDEHVVSSFTEKPTYTYYSNGGIYLMKSYLKEILAKGKYYNATDLMDQIIASDDTCLIHYPLLSYWLDIGKHRDYLKAQEDINHISLL